MKGADQLATRKAAGLLDRSGGLPDTFWYTTKRRLLGPPLVNQDLGEQRLSKPLALGVLSPDGISSSAYGTEEILIVLVPALGIAAFSLILPMTLVILFVMVLVLLSYREIVMVYIRPGGSYVVARENFGPRIAQVCAVALLIDYVVTVAVQIAAGTAAVASAFPGIGPYKLEICVGVVLLMCFGKPARDQGGGPGLRRADLPVRGRGHLDDHRRADPRGAGKPAAVTRTRCPAPTVSAPARPG